MGFNSGFKGLKDKSAAKQTSIGSDDNSRSDGTTVTLPCRYDKPKLSSAILRQTVTIRTAQWSLYVPYTGHYMYRTVVTICTVQWSLYVPYSGHYMYRQFNIQQFHVLPTQCIYVFCVDLRTNSDYFPIQH